MANSSFSWSQKYRAPQESWAMRTAAATAGETGATHIIRTAVTRSKREKMKKKKKNKEENKEEEEIRKQKMMIN